MAGNNHDKHDPAIGHETSDVNIGAIGKAVVALVLLAVFSYVGLLGLLRYFKSREDAEQIVAPPAHRVPPQPRLQSNPMPDLKAVIDAENQILHSYAWVDREKGVVRIPIENAIDLVAKRGLPVRSAVPPAGSTVTVPAESGPGTELVGKP